MTGWLADHDIFSKLLYIKSLSSRETPGGNGSVEAPEYCQCCLFCSAAGCDCYKQWQDVRITLRADEITIHLLYRYSLYILYILSLLVYNSYRPLLIYHACTSERRQHNRHNFPKGGFRQGTSYTKFDGSCTIYFPKVCWYMCNFHRTGKHTFGKLSILVAKVTTMVTILSYVHNSMIAKGWYEKWQPQTTLQKIRWT